MLRFWRKEPSRLDGRRRPIHAPLKLGLHGMNFEKNMHLFISPAAVGKCCGACCNALLCLHKAVEVSRKKAMLAFCLDA